VEHDLELDAQNTLTLMGEFHRMADADSDLEIDSITQTVNFPSDHGFVIGARHQYDFKNMLPRDLSIIFHWHMGQV